MKFVLTSLLLLAGIFGVAFVRAEDTPANALLVLAKHDNTLAIVDPSSLKELSRIPVGNDPHEVIASADGKTAYVSNYGFGVYHTLAVVDLVAQRALPSIDLGALRGPHGLAFAGGKVWFTAEAAKAIGSYAPASKSVDWILGTGQNRTHMIYVSPDTKLIVTSNINSGTVSIIEKTIGSQAGQTGHLEADWNETVVPVGKGAEGFDVSPDGKEIWAADEGGANRLKFTLDGKLALISMLRGAYVTVIDVGTKKTIKKISVGHGAAGVVMQPDGERAYVACTPDNFVAVIDLHSMEVVGRIQAGQSPDGLAWVMRRTEQSRIAATIPSSK